MLHFIMMIFRGNYLFIGMHTTAKYIIIGTNDFFFCYIFSLCVMQTKIIKAEKKKRKTPLTHKYEIRASGSYWFIQNVTRSGQRATQIVSGFDTLFAWWRVENWKREREIERENVTARGNKQMWWMKCWERELDLTENGWGKKFSNKLTYFLFSGSDIFMPFQIGMNSVSALELESLVDTLFDSNTISSSSSGSI